MHASTLIMTFASAAQPSLASWSLKNYADGSVCSGTPAIGGLSGPNNEDYECESGTFTHDIRAVGVEAAGKVVTLYSDAACFNVIGSFDTDGCQITPVDGPIAGITVRDA